MVEQTTTQLGSPPTGRSCDVCGRTPETISETVPFTEQKWYRVKYRYKDSPRYELECSSCHTQFHTRTEKRDNNKLDAEMD